MNKRALKVRSLVVLIVVFSVLFDQLSKLTVLNYLSEGSTVTFIPGFIDRVLIYNTGAAWGAGGSDTRSRILLVVISWAVAIGLLIYLIYVTIKKKDVKVGLWIILAFVLGGDIGNLIDRTFFYSRGVVDFISIQSWWPNFGIFNVADSILTCSLIALAIYIIVESVESDRREKHRIDEHTKK
jgi:signal peptidase II